jgi:hypothetical protein
MGYLLSLMMALFGVILLLTADGASLSNGTVFHFVKEIDSISSRLIYLTGFEFKDGRGYYDMVLDLTLTLNEENSDRGRNMLHLIICDPIAVQLMSNEQEFIQPLPFNTPGYCALTRNRTLGDLCTSVPLVQEDTSKEDKSKLLYHVQTRLTKELDLDLITSPSSSTSRSSSSSSSMYRYFYVDACETLGGQNGALRSCLNKENSIDSTSQMNTTCFQCPLLQLEHNRSSTPSNGNEGVHETGKCIIPPQMDPIIQGTVHMNLCDGSGNCLETIPAFLKFFYLGYTSLWGICALLWIGHLRRDQETALALQKRMQLVPITQSVYSAMTTAVLFTQSQLQGSARTALINGMILSQLFALTVGAEVIILIAKGWKITRAELPAKEHQWIRFVTLIWAASYAILKNSMVKHVTIFLLSATAWSSVVFMVWYNSAFNVNMLKYQMGIVRRRLAMDPSTTPVNTKYQLFVRFRYLLGGYMFLSCLVGVLGVVEESSATGYATRGGEIWRRFGTMIADESLNLGLYVALGYTFRCRHFHHVFQMTEDMLSPTSGRRRSSVVVPTQEEEGGQRLRETDDVGRMRLKKKMSGPDLKSFVGPSKGAAVIVVTNPDQAQALGTSLFPVKRIKQQDPQHERGGEVE